MRLNHEPVNGCSNRSTLTVYQGNHAASIVLAGEEPFEQADESFGAGYARYQKSANGVHIVRQISAAPSSSVKDGLPCLRFRITVENINQEPVRIAFSEEFPIQGCMLSFQSDQFGDDPLVHYENTMGSDGQLARAQLHCRFLKTMKAAENEIDFLSLYFFFNIVILDLRLPVGSLRTLMLFP